MSFVFSYAKLAEEWDRLNAARLQGGDIKNAGDGDLFFIDKAPGPEDKGRGAPVGRRAKRLALKGKPLRSELALVRPQNAPVIPSSVNNASATAKKIRSAGARTGPTQDSVAGELKGEAAREAGPSSGDIPWEDERGGNRARGHPASTMNTVDVSKISSHLRNYVVEHHNKSYRNRGPSNRIRRDELGSSRRPSEVPAKAAVVVDGPGSSFNPDRTFHQDAIAAAVGREEEKLYKESLLKQQLPTRQMLNSQRGEGTYNLDEMIMELQHDGGPDGGAAPESEDEDSDIDDVVPLPRSKLKPGERLTRSERARRDRHLQLQRRQQEMKDLKRQKRDLGELKKLKGEIDAEAEERSARKERRKTSARERAAEMPPKLSKYRYEPVDAPVLLSEEISGTLRRLPGTTDACALIRDRYKDLQRRGIIEPRKKVAKPKPSKKRKFVTPGLKGQLEEQMAAAQKTKKGKGLAIVA